MANTQTSLYRVLSNIDLSRNTIFNVSKVVGNQYENLDKNLEITPWDNNSSSNAAGNLILRSGVNSGSGEDGEVYIFSGVASNDTRGITLNPDSSIKLYAIDSTTGNIDVIANHQLFFKALENKITLKKVTESSQDYYVIELNNASATTPGKTVINTNNVDIDSSTTLDIAAGGTYHLEVNTTTSTETVKTLNVQTRADIDGVLDYDGTTFNVDATTKATIHGKELETKAGYASDPANATLIIAANSSSSSISTSNITATTALSSNTASTLAGTNTLSGSNTLKGATIVQDSTGAAGSLTVSTKDIDLDNSSQNGSTIDIKSKTVTLDASTLTISLDNDAIISGASGVVTVNADTVNATTANITTANITTANLDDVRSNDLDIQSKLFSLKSGYASDASASKLTLKTELVSGNYTSSLDIDTVTSDNETVSTKLTSSTETELDGTTVVQGAAGALNISTKDVTLNNSGINNSTVTVNTKTLSNTSTSSTEAVNGNATKTITGSLTETYNSETRTVTNALVETIGSQDTTVSGNYSLHAKSNTLILEADNTSARITADTITARISMAITAGSETLGTSANSGTITAPKDLTIVTPEIDVNVGNNHLLVGDNSSSTLTVTNVSASTVNAGTVTASDTITAPHVHATTDVKVGAANNGVSIYWDNTSNSIVFAKLG